MASSRLSFFLCAVLLALCAAPAMLAQTSNQAPVQILTAPQVVNNQGIATQIVLLNTASTACGFSAFAHVGAGNLPPNPVDLGGSQINFLNGIIPAQGSTMFDVNAPQGFLGAITVGIGTPACRDNVKVEARYTISNQTPLDELFSYPVPLPIALGSCAEIPINFDPDNADGNSSIPGIASVFSGPNPLQGDICHSLRDSNGQVVQPEICSPFDGSHQSRLLNEIFQNQGELDGVWRACVRDGQGATNPPGSVIDMLFIDVVQDSGRLQFGAKEHEPVNPGCPNGPDGVCLDDRFRVNVDFRTALTQPFQPGQGLVDGEDGFFFFLDPNNAELIVKIIDGCAINDRFWVFYGATTNVEFEITVTDTLTNDQRTFTNPLGTPFDAITDTQAFATCP